MTFFNTRDNYPLRYPWSQRGQEVLKIHDFGVPDPWIFMDFPNQLQLVATLAPSSGRVWECWDTFLLVPARDLAI